MVAYVLCLPCLFFLLSLFVITLNFQTPLDDDLCSCLKMKSWLFETTDAQRKSNVRESLVPSHARIESASQRNTHSSVHNTIISLFPLERDCFRSGCVAKMIFTTFQTSRPWNKYQPRYDVFIDIPWEQDISLFIFKSLIMSSDPHSNAKLPYCCCASASSQNLCLTRKVLVIQE